jgi:predicted  nucleic acid-binding Zn-ribbon protein
MNQAAAPAPGPSIAEQLVLLAELANVDAKQKSAQEKLDGAAGPARKLDVDLAALKKSLDDAHGQKANAETAKRAIENEIQDERIKIKKWEARANELRGEREHAALASEIGTAKRVIRQLEDKQLEQMEAIEAATELIGALTAKVTKADGAAKAEWDKVGGDLKALNAEQDQMRQARAALLAKLPAALVKRYETIAAKRMGVGVAIIKGEVCSACKRTLPPQLCIQIRKGLVLETCPSCVRLLVHETMTAAPAAPAT